MKFSELPAFEQKDKLETFKSILQAKFDMSYRTKKPLDGMFGEYNFAAYFQHPAFVNGMAIVALFDGITGKLKVYEKLNVCFGGLTFDTECGKEYDVDGNLDELINQIYQNQVVVYSLIPQQIDMDWWIKNRRPNKEMKAEPTIIQDYVGKTYNYSHPNTNRSLSIKITEDMVGKQLDEVLNEADAKEVESETKTSKLNWRTFRQGVGKLLLEAFLLMWFVIFFDLGKKFDCFGFGFLSTYIGLVPIHIFLWDGITERLKKRTKEKGKDEHAQDSHGTSAEAT